MRFFRKKAKIQEIKTQPVIEVVSYDTKIKMVKTHLVTKGNISSWEAIELYHATRLSDIIFKLKKQGLEITSTPETKGKSRFVRYYYASFKN